MDTSAGPTTLILPEGIGLQNVNPYFYFADMTGNAATNPITIESASAADTINGLESVQINTNHGNAMITGVGALPRQVTSQFTWICAFGGLGSSSQQGGGSGIQLLEFDVTFTKAQITAMFANPDLGALEILGIPPAESVYDIITVNAIPNGSAIVVASGNPVIQASTGVGAFPMFQTSPTWANGADSAGLPPCIFNAGNTSGNVLRELNSGTFVLCSDAAYAVTGGGFSLRVYGLYRIKATAI